MADWMDRACRDWDELRAESQRIGWRADKSTTLAQCALLTGLEWYDTRSADLVNDFLRLQGSELIRLRNFGRTKIQKLIGIVSKTLSKFPQGMTTPEEQPELFEVVRYSFPEGFQKSGIAIDWPLKLTLLPIRVLHFAEEQGWEDLLELMDYWQAKGSAGLMQQRNLGRKSVSEVEQLALSILAGDRVSLARWLPVDLNGEGMSLTRGLENIIRSFEKHQIEMLQRRLVLKSTLEESAREFGVTRERVRQLEETAKSSASSLLSRFHLVYQSMVENWMGGRAWKAPLSPIRSPFETELTAGLLESLFNDLPQAAARSLQRESLLEQWHQELRDHPDLLVEGVVLSSFMQEHIPDQYREEFCLSLNGRGRLKLDHTSGRVFYSEPNLREVVKAILDREDDPVPLTWLVELVRQTPSHPDVKRDQIAPYRARWKSDDPSFPRDKVIWDE